MLAIACLITDWLGGWLQVVSLCAVLVACLLVCCLVRACLVARFLSVAWLVCCLFVRSCVRSFVCVPLFV